MLLLACFNLFCYCTEIHLFVRTEYIFTRHSCTGRYCCSAY